MSPNELKTQFDEVAAELLATRTTLNQLRVWLSRADDQKALRGMIADLTWACENCTVIGLHQVGRALDHNMGTGCKV
jgi:hypothetical protein